MKISKELVKGSTAILVLSVISRKPMYGYQIIREIEQLSDSVFHLNEGTLYPILHSLEEENYLDCYWEDSESGRKQKYYSLTDKGKKELAKQQREWMTFSTAVAKVIQGGAYGTLA